MIQMNSSGHHGRKGLSQAALQRGAIWLPWTLLSKIQDRGGKTPLSSGFLETQVYFAQRDGFPSQRAGWVQISVDFTPNGFSWCPWMARDRPWTSASSSRMRGGTGSDFWKTGLKSSSRRGARLKFFIVNNITWQVNAPLKPRWKGEDVCVCVFPQAGINPTLGE